MNKALCLFVLIVVAMLVAGSLAFDRYEAMALAHTSARESLIDARRQVDAIQ